MVNLYVSCIVLSAGESKRMDKPKLLLPLGERTILEQTIDNFFNSKVNEVIVVVGNRAEEMTSLLANRPVKVAVNPIYRQGMSTSILAGLSLTGDKTQAVMLALAKKGLGRQKAHEITRQMAIKSHNQQRPFKEVLLENNTIKELLKLMHPNEFT